MALTIVILLFTLVASVWLLWQWREGHLAEPVEGHSRVPRPARPAPQPIRVPIPPYAQHAYSPNRHRRSRRPAA